MEWGPHENCRAQGSDWAHVTIMAEIDFLPVWYKDNKRRQISMRRQYIALGTVFVAMMMWNLIATNSISKATVQLSQAEAERAEAEDAIVQTARINNQVTHLHEKAQFIEKIDSRIDVGGVLAEFSFLVGERIVLSRVEFIAERFTDEQQGKQKKTSSVRVAKTKLGEKQKAPLGDVRLRIMLQGIAADASDVAALICRLEDSPYFQRVYPSFSRNTKLKVASNVSSGTSDVLNQDGNTENVVDGTEFEISCYLANYVESTTDTSQSI